MDNGKSITELPVPKRARTCKQGHHNIEYSPEHEVLISLANEMFGLHEWSHTVTHQNIGKCILFSSFSYIITLYFKTGTPNLILC
jgi:hypothetical protein